MLLRAKADVGAFDHKQHTPIHHAASRGHTETVKLLGQAMGDVDVLDMVRPPLYDLWNCFGKPVDACEGRCLTVSSLVFGWPLMNAP